MGVLVLAMAANKRAVAGDKSGRGLTVHIRHLSAKPTLSNAAARAIEQGKHVLIPGRNKTALIASNGLLLYFCDAADTGHRWLMDCKNM